MTQQFMKTVLALTTIIKVLASCKDYYIIRYLLSEEQNLETTQTVSILLSTEA